MDTIAGLLSRKPTSLWDCMEDFACSTALSKRFLFDRKRSSCPVRMDSLDWCKLTSLSSRTRSRLFIASRSYKKKTHSHIPETSPKLIELACCHSAASIWKLITIQGYPERRFPPKYTENVFWPSRVLGSLEMYSKWRYKLVSVRSSLRQLESFRNYKGFSNYFPENFSYNLKFFESDK